MQNLLKLVLPFMFLLMQTAVGFAQTNWLVANAGKQVMVTTDSRTWVPLRKGDTVPNGAWVSTGNSGRAQLVRGKESIIFKPNTLAALTTQGFFFRKTEVLQQTGELELQIEKRGRPHTTIQTPFLAAVVKGTRFTVTVGRRDARVDVDEGLVEVTSFARGERSNLKPGQSALVNKGGMQVAGKTEVPSISRVEPPAQRVPAVGQTLKDLNKSVPDAAASKGKSTNSNSLGNSANDKASDASRSGGSGRGDTASGSGRGDSASGSGSGSGKGSDKGHSEAGSSNGLGDSAGSSGKGKGKDNSQDRSENSNDNGKGKGRDD